MDKVRFLPDEYYLLEDNGDQIVIGMGFKHFNKDCAPFICVNGNRYNAGPLTIIPKNMANCICSAREYIKDNPTHD